jgi:hypothetical protein
MPARAAIVLSAALLAAGCGGSSSDGEQARTQTVPQRDDGNPLELPANVPLKPSGKADAGQASVIRAWSGAMRAGDVVRASALWAVPAKVQNGTPVLTLPDRAHVLIFNAALPCGSVVTATGGAARGFTIATFRLTRRRGADCGSGTGNTARTAIRVRDGKIAEWYRLPDDPDAPGLDPPPAPPDGDVVES